MNVENAEQTLDGLENIYSLDGYTNANKLMIIPNRMGYKFSKKIWYKGKYYDNDTPKDKEASESA